MGNELILAIDQGTTSTRALIFNASGEIVAKAQKELTIFTPHSGWVEQDASRIWADVVSVCREALSQVQAHDVIGIGITNQRETTVIWDKKTGNPVYNAIVWQDRRTAEYCRNLKESERDIQSKTGLLADPYFSATKIKWIMDHTQCHADDVLFGTIDCWLLWNLTGGQVHATDASNAARTMIFDIHRQCWDSDLCDRLGIPMTILPKVCDNMAGFGMADATLFGKEFPVLAMAGDQQAATFGQACFYDGMVKSTYGTGCFALMNTGEQCLMSDNRLLSTIAWRIDGKPTYALEGSIFVAGAAVQFLRDNLKMFTKAGESEALALSVSDTDGVVFVPSFTGLGAPYWNPDVRGAILGLSRGTTPAHITRAVLDAQAYQTRDLITAMTKDAGQDVTTIRVDGGLIANNYICQQLADQSRARIDRPVQTEATVWGVAAMAFMQAGVFKSFKDIEAVYSLDQSFEPLEHDDDGYDQWQSAIAAVQLFSDRRS